MIKRPSMLAAAILVLPAAAMAGQGQAGSPRAQAPASGAHSMHAGTTAGEGAAAGGEHRSGDAMTAMPRDRPGAPDAKPDGSGMKPAPR